MRQFNWKTFFSPIASLWFKSNCPLCQRPAEKTFCIYCEKQLQRCRFPEGGHFTLKGKIPVFVWGEYADVVKRSIARLKYDHHRQIAQPLGYWLAESWLNYSQFPTTNLIAVPIPLHSEKLKKRGFNQAELLANSFCQLTGLPSKPQGLMRIKATDALYGLSGSDRQKMMQDAFILGKGLTPNQRQSVVLVDDIYTTGATLITAVETLAKSGIKVAGAVAIATTQKIT